MRVLHLDTGREWRGGQTQLLHLATGQGGAVALPDDAPLRPALERAGVEVYAIPRLGRWGGGRKIRAAIAAYRPDLVAAHTSHAHGHALSAGLPVVVHRRVDFAPRARAKYARARGYVAVSAAVGRVLESAGVPGSRIVVVHDGIDPAPLDAAAADPGRRPGSPLILAVGALVPHKGHVHLVEAMAHLPGVHLAIVGEGALRSALERRARELGVSGRVHLLGARPDVPVWLKTADLLVHPSVEEGLGQVLVEALVAGIRVVATRAGGISELLPEPLVPPRDPVRLAAAIREALASPRPAPSTAARERWSVRAMIDGTVAAYARFLADGGGP